ncbi:MAG: hypothetical protein QN188_02810 [Armatimonadota bacterium]|nr:hypothetical protein [Armatimonadota bacterium]MDR5676017.1 hypothetical protein [Armatimonadota bacterium]MDR7387928.1 hypothetical protein [Armatimonadota bacterium]MDR7389791.1 hypothetical protein [Armatimonadota bacterium]MDR7391424.1 hypothetical protein [Armatimonadota bacterium]
MGVCARCGSPDLRQGWEWRSHRIGGHVLAGWTPTVWCGTCGTLWPWAQRQTPAVRNPWLVDRLSPALAYLQAEGDLIVVRWPDGSYEVVA